MDRVRAYSSTSGGPSPAMAAAATTPTTPSRITYSAVTAPRGSATRVPCKGCERRPGFVAFARDAATASEGSANPGPSAGQCSFPDKPAVIADEQAAERVAIGCHAGGG